jgi:hypothetical protein
MRACNAKEQCYGRSYEHADILYNSEPEHCYRADDGP